MRNSIIAVLVEWVWRLGESEFLADRPLKVEVLGVARFLKEVAFKENDIELMGMATQTEMALTERMRVDSEEERAFSESQARDDQIYQDIRNECKRIFAVERFSVDTSKYRALIDKRKPSDKVLARLNAYLNEKKILAQLRVNVANKMEANLLHSGRLPSSDEVKAEFGLQLADFYRRADRTVPGLLVVDDS